MNTSELESAMENDFFVVGIGASAGGLEALEEFFSNTPEDSGMAYIVIQHLSPDFDSVMDQLLARKTNLPIRLITNGMKIRPDSIYILPPKKEAILASGSLLLADRADNEALSFPIDHFFRSLAQDAGQRAVGVVLSGTGTDGSRGILDIHSVGGLVAAQSEDSARFDGMPRSACATGVVDMALAAEELPTAILRHANTAHLPTSHRLEPTEYDVAPFFKILNRLNEKFGLDFSHYKVTTINRRIERRLVLSDTCDLETYSKRIINDNSELERLYRDLLIGVTGFFRDKEVFDRLEIDVIPQIVDEIDERDELRCWVAACATGEEAYSLAILLAERMEARNKWMPVRIFASDVHSASLETASKATYNSDSLAGVTAERMERYFIERSDGHQVSPEIRKMVVFTSHNILRDAPFTKLDIVTCRNMLIYLTPQAQKKALSLFHFGLKRNGVLILGMSETTGDLRDEFEPIEERNRIYRKHRDVTLPAVNRQLPPMHRRMQSPYETVIPQRNPGKNLLTAYDQLLDRYMPTGVLIGPNRELIHSFSGVNKFFQVRDGRASTDILDLVLPELRSPVSAAIRRVKRDKNTITYGGIECDTGESTEDVKVTVWGLEGPDVDGHFMVQFESSKIEPRPAETERIDASEFSSDEFESLERELQYTKDSLQSTIEELQTTNEELQSANEQLTSSNEELQSTNEELHSVNEELYTVNAEHQRKIDELTDLNNDMDNLLTSTDVHTVFLDRDLNIRRFTPGIADVFSLIQQDIGRRFDSFSHRIEHDSLIEEIEQVLRSSKPFAQEVSDTRGVWYLLRILPYVARGQVDGVVVTLVDVTTLREAQSRLEEMSEIVQHSDDAIYRVDLDGNIRTWNMGASKLYGYESADAIGKNLLLLTPPDRLSEPMTYLDRMKEGLSVDHVETEQRRRNDTIVQVSLTVSPIRDHKGTIVGASVVARDVTKQKRAEEEIRQAVRQRDQFLATLSHELRNPLAAILNATNLLQEESLDVETAAEAREVVDHQLRHVARLLDDLLDVARFTNGKLMLRCEVVDLSRIAMTVVECVQYQIDERGQSLHVDVPSDPIYVDGDVGRLQQAQVNLLVNASKYSPEGRTIRYAVGCDGEEAVVCVRDDGDGISSALLPSIFEPFVQAEQSIERSQGGMGLGLPLVKMIANSHGGSVSAFSGGPGRGSEFTVRIPQTDKRPKDIDNVSTPVCEGQRLVLIEDNDGIRKMLARSLELKGFEVSTAANGRDGMGLLCSENPDVAVVDIGLPDINGYELAQSVRANPQCDQINLIAVTGYGREEDRRKAIDAGFDLHIVKPINPPELLEAISKLPARKTAPK